MPAGHHYVPQFYQRQFAAGGRIQLFDKRRPAPGTVVSVEKVFVKNGDNSWFDISGIEHDEVETAWLRIETVIAPVIQRLNLDPTDLRAGDDVALTTLMANLLARSRSMSVVGRDITASVTAETVESAEGDKRLQQAFINGYDREPLPGELRAIVTQGAEEFANDHWHVLDATVRHHERMCEMLSGHHVQVVRPREDLVGFSFGDSPVILQNNDGRVGLIEGLAVGDAQLIFLPLGRYLGVCLTAEPEDVFVELGPRDIDLVNSFTWRSAVRFVGAHLGEHPATVVPDYRAWLESAS